MIQAIERLKHGHDALKPLLAVLERQVQAVRLARQPDYVLMRDILHYLSDYADRRHHAVEDLIFEQLAVRRPSHAEAVALLAAEHRHLADSGRRCRDMIDAVLNGSVLSRQLLHESLRFHLRAYQRHMRREQGALLDEARRHLTPADWVLIDTRYHWQGDDAPEGTPLGDGCGALFEQIRDALDTVEHDASGQAWCRACAVD